jgi:hypothetical protein
MAGNQPPQTEVLPTNGWLMDIDAGDHNLRSPHFHKVTGMSRKTGTLEVVDGGTNYKMYFTDGILDHGNVTIVRSRDGSADDQAFAEFIRDCFATGKKRSGSLIQYRFGKQVLEIRFKGLLCHEYALTDFDTAGSDKSDQTYTCAADWWEDTHTPV